jgi:protein-tyrosine phosphatase
MAQFRFGAASPEEKIVYGAQRPGYPSRNVDGAHVGNWISFMQQRGIRRVCCLLPTEQLTYYRVDLLDKYCEAFGESNVCRAEIEDYHLCGHVTLERSILPFLVESDRAGTPVVVHCSGGSGRTGHVLAAWLVRHRGMSIEDALAIVSRQRNPREAVQCGYATEKELRCLLAGGVSEHPG